MVPAEATTNVMNATPITEKPDMKIGYRRSNDGHYSQPLFVMVTKFETDSFPVRVRYFRLGQCAISQSLSEAGSRKRQESAPRDRQGDPDPCAVDPEVLESLRRTANWFPTS